MKKIFLAVVFTICSFLSFSQKKDSVTCIPNAQLREAVRVNERYKIVVQENDLMQTHINTLTSIISNRDSALNNALQLSKNKDTIINILNDKYAAANQKYIIANSYATGLNKQLKKQKFKTVLTGVVGAVASGLLLWLFLTK